MPGKQKTEKIIFTNGVGSFTTFQNLKFTNFMNNGWGVSGFLKMGGQVVIW